jgi:diacylglycerol kinase (ATP)
MSDPSIDLAAPLHTTLIYNPASGSHDVRSTLQQVARDLTDQGWQVEVQLTAQAGDVTRLAQRARDHGHQIVFVAGGDGSLNEAANALANSPVALAALPSGTANVWARQIGLPIPQPLHPDRLREAAQLLRAGCLRTIDLGQTDGRYFLMWLGVGLDAEVTATLEPRPVWVKRLGMVGYGLHGAWSVRGFRGTPMEVSVDDHRVRSRALMVLVSNTQLYGAFLKAVPAAALDDGWLDVCIFKGDRLIDIIPHVLRTLLRRVRPHPRLVQLRGQHIRINSERSCYVHVDAEPIGRTPVEVQIAPRALRVLVPRHAPASLFSNHPEDE